MLEYVCQVRLPSGLTLEDVELFDQMVSNRGASQMHNASRDLAVSKCSEMFSWYRDAGGKKIEVREE